MKSSTPPSPPTTPIGRGGLTSALTEGLHGATSGGRRLSIAPRALQTVELPAPRACSQAAVAVEFGLADSAGAGTFPSAGTNLEWVFGVAEHFRRAASEILGDLACWYTLIAAPRLSQSDRKVHAVVQGVVADVLGPRMRSRLPTRPDAIVTAICQTVLTTTSLPGLNGPELTAGVTTFVHGQLQALPRALRLSHAAALAGFAGWVRLRHGARFGDLPLETRREIISAWAYGRFLVARQLFRPLRSTALLAAYEHSVGRPYEVS